MYVDVNEINYVKKEIDERGKRVEIILAFPLQKEWSYSLSHSDLQKVQDHFQLFFTPLKLGFPGWSRFI